MIALPRYRARPAHARFGFGGLVTVALVALGLAACSRSTPAPVIYKGQAMPPAASASDDNAARPKTRLPAAGTTIGGRVIAVRPGETIYTVSRRVQVPLHALITVNRLRPPYRLRVGQKLIVPRVQIHAVAEGETLYGISRRYGVDMYRLAKTNGIRHPFGIATGDRLAIPVATARIDRSAPAKARARSPPPCAAASPRRAGPGPPPAGTPMPPRAAGKFAWPVRGRVISGFGAKRGGLHNDGINIAVSPGAPVKAAENGVVAYVGNELPGFGNLLLIRHAGGYTTAYAHSAEILVRRGQRVARGQLVARAGSTGSVDRPQLHFEIRKGRKAVNPLSYLAGVPVAVPVAVERAKISRSGLQANG